MKLKDYILNEENEQKKIVWDTEQLKIYKDLERSYDEAYNSILNYLSQLGEKNVTSRVEEHLSKIKILIDRLYRKRYRGKTNWHSYGK
jgi:hypothetical protein